MTDLTDKWKKGELPDGDYYIKRRNGLLLYDNIDSRGVWRNSIDEDIVEVLAPVPSYEEWQDINKRLKKTQELELEVRRENTKLKELLKEVLRHELSLKEISELTRKICQALGEDKCQLR